MRPTKPLFFLILFVAIVMYLLSVFLRWSGIDALVFIVIIGGSLATIVVLSALVRKFFENWQNRYSIVLTLLSIPIFLYTCFVFAPKIWNLGPTPITDAIGFEASIIVLLSFLTLVFGLVSIRRTKR